MPYLHPTFYLITAALVSTVTAADQHDIYGHIADLVRKDAPSGSYSSWLDKDSNTKKVDKACSFVCITLVESPDLKPEIAKETGQTCYYSCLAKAMPSDWPYRVKVRNAAFEHYDRATVLGSPITVRPTIDP